MQSIVIISIATLLSLILLYRNRISAYYFLFFGAVCVASLGFYQIAAAKDLATAIQGNQVVYLGASFIPMFLLACVANLCKVKVRHWMEALFLLISVVILGLAMTVGKLDWYYAKVEYAQLGGIAYLTKTYGPLHILYPIYLGVAVVGALVMTIHSIRKTEVSWATSITLLVSSILAVSVYAVERGLHLPFELMPYAYCVLEIVILFLLRRISLYNVTAISTDSMVKSRAHGFVIVDSRGKYLGSDDAAKSWFPELKKLKIDTRPKQESTELLKQTGSWIRGEAESETALFPVGESTIMAQHSIIIDKLGRRIHCVYLQDDTKHQQYMRLIEKYNENLERDVEEKTKNLDKVQNDIIISMASIVENRDANTGGHIARTSDVVKIFVDHLRECGRFPRLPEDAAQCIIKAAPLHDFGKIGIPDEVLNKPGKFTEEEYEIMKQHPAKGAVIVE